MGWWNKLSRRAEGEVQKSIRDQLADTLVQHWPAGLPVTPENLRELSKEYNILHLGQESFAQPIQDDADEADWRPVKTEEPNAGQREEAFNKVRELCKAQPHCRRALNLYVNYVFGADFNITLKPRDKDKKASSDPVVAAADHVWKQTLKHNRKWWTSDEFCRRTYRDGEQFTRIFEDGAFVEFRFIDPEDIRGEDDDESKGVVTDPDDVAKVTGYELYDREAQKVVDTIEAQDIFHTKIDCDSTEKRGRSRFVDLVWIGKMLEAFTRNEVIHRNMQSSIVLIRKVDGSANNARLLLDNSKTGSTQYPEQTLNREKIRPGTIHTTHKGVSVEFAQPKSDFSDASPLAKFLIQNIAAVTGWTYTMLAASADDGSLASALVQESPVLQMVNAERKFFAGEWEPIYERVLAKAIASEEIPGVSNAEQLWEDYEIDFRWGNVVARDTLKDAQAGNIAVMCQSISRRELSRRLGVDPDQMRREIEDESKQPFYTAGFNAQNGDIGDKAVSSQGNAAAGGTNQGKTDPISHKDKQ